MGTAPNISHDQYPKQGRYLNARAEVCFRYDTRHVVMGTIVRDDREAPWVTIIRLDDGRDVLASECMWSPTDYRKEPQ